MTPEEAELVRANAWTTAMRKTHQSNPGFYAMCACQYGLTSWCQHDRHQRCHRAVPQRDYETVVCGAGGHPLHFAGPYEHDSDVSATGPHRESLVMVWLADRVCAWQCPCECGHPEPEPKPEPEPEMPVQLDLFAEVG